MMMNQTAAIKEEEGEEDINGVIIPEAPPTTTSAEEDPAAEAEVSIDMPEAPPVPEGDDDDPTVNNVRRNNRGSDRDSLRSSINMLQPPPPPPEKEKIAHGESRAVLYLRIAVLLVLLASTIALCVLIATFLKDNEVKEFENQFHSDATKVMDTVGKNMADTLEKTDAVIQELVVYAHYANMTWPFVTMPGFSQTVLKALKVTKGLNIVIYPKVEHDQQPQWEEYAANNGRQWVDEGFDVMERDTDWMLPINRTYDVSSTLYGLEGPYPPYNASRTDYINPFYTPAWQNAPSAPKALVGYPYNYDFMFNPIYSEALLQYAIPQQSVVMYPDISGIIYNETDEFQVFLANVYWDFARQFLSPEENEKEPFLTCILPIFAASWDSVRVDRSKPASENDFVGTLVSSFYVRDFLNNLLPERSRGILTSFENCRNEIFTYEINGDTPTFVGVGKTRDWEKYHSEEGGNMAQTATLGELVEESNAKRKSRYSGLPLSDDPCPFTLHVYPSQEMEDEYITNKPHFYAFIVAMVFIFTSIVFLIYDRLVAKRQKIVMARALASGEIVSDLFPEKVRKQLYQEKEEAQKKREEDKKKATAAADTLTTLNPLRSSGQLAVYLNQPQNLQRGDGTNTKPLADLFHETTIFFADLVGFTSWSSVRSPTEVFQLLEGIFHAFDKIAAKRRVFKVETIGDCYVAVTGIPEPQDDHAVIMCKFANDCINKMHIVVHDLADALGPDTADLDMRVGLHSGSTTAGVLRGEKGRFQLFGDTVNTASRMESNGVKGRIQVSQATADSLIKKGKETWLIPRKEKVQAKGKGEMQTYFISIGGSPSIISGMSTATLDTTHTGVDKDDE